MSSILPRLAARNPDALLTISQAAALLGVGPNAITLQIHRGNLEGVKQGRIYVVTAAAVERYDRFRRRPGAQGGRPPRPLAERFWEKVDKSGGPDACWPWLSGRDSNGYGEFQTNGDPDHPSSRAPRIAWELTNGPIPPGMEVCHKCDDPPCTNPGHFFLGTAQHNAWDKVAKGRAPRGEDNPATKLTDVQVRDIRSRDYSRYGTQQAVAREFGVTGQTIRAIRDGLIWQHVIDGPPDPG